MTGQKGVIPKFYEVRSEMSEARRIDSVFGYPSKPANAKAKSQEPLSESAESVVKKNRDDSMFL